MLQRARLLACVVLVAILSAFAILEIRLFIVQMAEGPRHAERARRLQVKEVPVKVPRGRILDRRGRVLAASVPCLDVYANTKWLENPHTKYRREKDETIEILSRLLGLDESRLRERIASRVRSRPGANHCVLVARKVTDPKVVGKLRRLKEQKFLRGVDLVKGFARAYPEGALLGHVVGFVDDECRGVFGVEALADGLLRGRNGARRFQRDGVQNEIFSSVAALRSGTPGGDLKLTLDATIQLFAVRELERIQREFTPAWAAAVVLEPGTGRILAAASAPSLDPRRPAEGEPAHWTDSVFKAEYNPGSSFKPLMMALAWDAGVVDPGERIDCERGRWRIGRRTVTDDHGGYGLLTPAEIVVHSSNIGISKIALRLVPEDARRGSGAFAPILDHLRLLGLGRRPGVLRPCEESPGILTPLEKWSRTYTLVSVSFGYEMTVTPIQMAAAFLTIADGGVYVPPRLVESYAGADGSVIEAPKAPSCRVFSASSAGAVTKMLRRVVEEGTGKPARIAGCPVAGKTGTSRRDRGKGGHTSSFVAFAPAGDPALLVLVVVDGPRGAIYGSKVAAPAVRNILEEGLDYLGVRPDELVLARKKGGGDAGP